MTDTIARPTLLGATGSVGRSTIDAVARHPERFRVEAPAAGANREAMLPLAGRPRSRVVAPVDAVAAGRRARALAEEASRTEALAGDRIARALAFELLKIPA